MKQRFWFIDGNDQDSPLVFADEEAAKVVYQTLLTETIAEYTRYCDSPAEAAKLAAESIRLSSEEMVVVATSAPKNHDGFGTVTVGDATFIGKSLRLVATPVAHAEWQACRYMSGLHGALPAEKADSYTIDTEA